MKLLDGKVVAITGAGGGLGRAYALHIAGLGARLVINDLGGARDGSGEGQAMADKVVDEVKELGGEAVASYASVVTMEGGASVVQTAVDAFGRLDVLVNNAGILRDKSLIKMTEEMWDAVMAVHLKGTFSCSLAAVRQMKDQRVAGSIINTTSYAGLKGNFGQTNYAAAKAGVYAMTLVNAMELSRFDIRVNAIAPLAKTRMTEDIALVPDSMTAEHVAPMVAYLASDLSSSVTGRIFGVHGGHMFEYRMETTDGLERESWTVEQVAEQLPRIAGAAAPAPEAAPAEAAAPGASASREPATPQEKVSTTFRFMPEGFNAARAKSWAAVIQWEIVGTGDFTITIGDGQCTSAEGKQGSADCVVKTDTDTFLGITDGSVDGTQAYMQGKITATNVGALMRYQKVIDPRQAQAAYEAWVAGGSAGDAAAAPAAPATTAPAAPATTAPAEEPAKALVVDALPVEARLRMLLGLLPELAGEQEADHRVHLDADGFICTVSADGGEVKVEVGHQGKATGRVHGTADALWGLFTGADGRKLLTEAAISASSMDELRWLLGCCGDDPAGELAAEVEARGAGVNRSALGTTFHGDPLIITEDEILDFARATNDDNPYFVDTKQDGGVIAPPLFPVRYYNVLFARVLTDPALGVDVARLLFGEMEMRFNLPVRPRDLVVAKAVVDSIEDKESGQVLRLSCRLMCEGEAVATSTATFFIRWEESRIRRLATPTAAKEMLGEVAFAEAMTIRDDQTNDFAEASNDPNPIHLDEKYATSAGLPGIIVHGPCNMAFCGKAFVDAACEGEPSRLRALKVRFSKPARPGQTLTTRAYKPVAGDDGEKVYRFEARNDEGEPIITEGIARVR